MNTHLSNLLKTYEEQLVYLKEEIQPFQSHRFLGRFGWHKETLNEISQRLLTVLLIRDEIQVSLASLNDDNISVGLASENISPVLALKADGSIYITLLDLDRQLIETWDGLARRHLLTIGWLRLQSLRQLRLDQLQSEEESEPDQTTSAIPRSTRDEEPLGWWWYLDSEYVNRSGLGYATWRRRIIWIGEIIAGIVIGIFALPEIIVATSQQLGTLFSSLISFGDSALGLDVIAIGGIVLQLVIGIQTAIFSARRFANRTNQMLYRVPVVRYFLPIHQFIIGLLVFWFAIAATNGLINQRLVMILNQQVDVELAQGSLGDALALTDASVLLTSSDAQVENQLVVAGILREEIGDFEGARTIYERALEANTANIYAQYYLARLIIDHPPAPDDNEVDDSNRRRPRTPYDRAMILLDSGLQLLTEELQETQEERDDSMSEDEIAELDGEIEFLTKLDFAYLVARARIYYEQRLPNLADSDLFSAETLIDDNPSYFYVGDGAAEYVENPYSAVEYFYYRALVDEALGNDARANWMQVFTLARQTYNQERLWQQEAVNVLFPSN